MPTFFPKEKDDIREALRIGEQWGYGNLIAWLATAWAKRLMEKGIPKEGAEAVGGGRIYPIEWLDELEKYDE